MGEWSEYFEDFPEENPANWQEYSSSNGEELRAKQNYSPKFQAREQQVKEAATARKLKNAKKN